MVADNLVVDRKVANNAEELRGLAVAANGDIYAKGKFEVLTFSRRVFGKGASPITAAQVAAQRRSR